MARRKKEKKLDRIFFATKYAFKKLVKVIYFLVISNTSAVVYLHYVKPEDVKLFADYIVSILTEAGYKNLPKLDEARILVLANIFNLVYVFILKFKEGYSLYNKQKK